MRYKNLIPYKHQNLPIFDVEIMSIDEIKIYQTERTKITFTARELLTDRERQCVVWSDKNLTKGDILQIKGWKREEVFIVASFLRVKKADSKRVENG